MAEVKCLNCGYHFELVKTYYDVDGLYTVCPKCGVSFDTDEEVELSSEQTARNDEVYETVFAMCKVLTEDEELEWNMAYIGEIADFAASTLALAGNRVRFPAVVMKEDGSQYVEEFVEEQREC